MLDEERRSRVRLSVQNGAARALMSSETEEEAVSGVLAAVGAGLGWPLGELWRPDEGGSRLRLAAAWTDPVADVRRFREASRGREFAPGAGLPGHVWQRGEPAWVEDVLTDPRFARGAAAAAVGLHGAFAVPVPTSAGVYGVLQFMSRARMEPDPELLETMMAVGAQLGQFVERTRAVAAVRESEERFRTFARTMPDATFLIDADGRIVFVNDAVRTVFGYGPEELQGRLLEDLTPDHHREAYREGLRRLLEADRQPDPWERVRMVGLRKDGGEVPLEVSYGSYEKEGRRFITGIARDITDRRQTERRLRFQASLLDAVGEAVIATDLDGKILFWNAFAERLYGWSAEEVTGRDITEVTPTEMSRAQAREIMDRLRAGESWAGEFMVRDRSGREFPVFVTDSPIHDASGRLIGVIGTSKDITERHRAESAQRFLADAGRVLSSSLEYESTIPAVAQLAVPLLGDWCVIHLAGGDGDHPLAVAPDSVSAGAGPSPLPVLQQVLTGPDGLMAEMLPRTRPLRIRPGDGTPAARSAAPLRDVGIRELMAVPLRSREHALGLITFALTSAGRSYDETDEWLATELALRAGSAIDNAHLFREAQESSRAKTDFLAVVSHELRTPLNAITGYADLLRTGVSGDLNDQQKRQLERIKVGAQHLAHIIDEILAFARVESGRETVELERTDLGQIAREAAVVLEPEARRKSLELRVDVPDPGPQLVTDAPKVRQILVNLLSNAVKYTEEGGVRVTVRELPDAIEVAVSDTGIGIPAEEHERIFEPFRQVQSPNTRTIGGTGLGLSVNRRLTQLIGGTLTVESAPGAGSTFTLRLPRDPAERG